MVGDTRDRTVKQLCAARFGGEINPGLNGRFAVQYPGIGFKQSNVVFRDRNFRPARHDAVRIQTLDVQAVGFRALLDGRQKRGVGWTQVNDPGALKNAFFGECGQLIPQRLSPKHQRYITFTFAVSVTDQTGIAVMASFRVGGEVGINHQHFQARLRCVITGGRSYGAASDNDQIVFHRLLFTNALLAE